MHDEPPTSRRLQAFCGAKSVGHLSQRDEELWYAMTSEDYNPRMESTLSFLTLLTSGLFAGAALYVTAVPPMRPDRTVSATAHRGLLASQHFSLGSSLTPRSLPPHGSNSRRADHLLGPPAWRP
jgi:hypothetical protein